MLDSLNGFISASYLRSVWTDEYEIFKDSEAERRLLDRLQNWSKRTGMKETSAEAAFIGVFFQETWGYTQSGQAGTSAGYTLWPKFPISGAGATGGPGEADLAIGYFGGSTAIPQVLCEFKSIKSALDADQKRKGNTRSPVRQCLDYLSHARKGMIGSEPIVPTWAIVTDMNEFRLYWYDRGHTQFARFVIDPRDLFQGPGLLANTEAARFDRFVFARLFHRDTLLTTGGRSLLLQEIQQRRFRDREIEDAFYREYRHLREHLYTQLLAHNGEGTPRFPGTRGRLVRLAQKILDRLLFVFFCEDMGQALAFPPKLLQEFLVERANDKFFNAGATTIWQEMLALFDAMNNGTAFGGRVMHQFNGGLFAPDLALEPLIVPNSVFCQHLQGQNEASIGHHKLTVLYLCATYNYAADLGEGVARQERTSLGLYMLGRVFEQSITELEIKEAEADNRPSLNKLSKRKTDGVYYTPEWVVERVVDGTLGPCLSNMRAACGWPADGSETQDVEAIDRYLDRLRIFTVLDPACGSGAFLIATLRYLSAEWQRIRALRRRVSDAPQDSDVDQAALVRDLLRTNIYGVDINPASVEIAQLALWLHTARGDQPLSSLDHTIRCGNSLVTDDYYRNVQLNLDATEQERVNAFDWRTAFPEVSERGGFDAVIGNPPYVKLQNLRAVQPDIAEYLVNGRLEFKPYTSTRTGNFDLYLPFIEQGLAMLNPTGRLGYIAPSLWTVNEYGAGLRELVADGKHLDRWLDFKSFQVFEEATTYTALQFFSKSPTKTIRAAQAPRGSVPSDPWEDAGSTLDWGAQEFGDRWLLLTGAERALVNRLAAICKRLDDPSLTTAIFQGMVTSADDIYHLRRLGPCHYEYTPLGKNPRPPPYEVAIEDAVMRPLVSGAEAKRYTVPQTDTWLLFPYEAQGTRTNLIPTSVMASKFPKTWEHLLAHRKRLEMREARIAADGTITGPVHDCEWHRYVYPKSLGRHDAPKLIVPRLVARLGCAVDEAGEWYLDNADVSGIALADAEDPWYLAAILNAPVADFVFRRISKPFRGDYLSANKQFIAPLPIPPATAEQRSEVGAGARELQRLHTLRRDTLALLARRLDGAARRRRPETWLLHGLPPLATLQAKAPASTDAASRRAWAKREYTERLTARYNAIRPHLRPGAALDATLTDGELAFLIDGVAVVDRVFVDPAEASFVLAQWKVLASQMTFTEKSSGKTLCDALRNLAARDNIAMADQVIHHAAELVACEAAIRAEEDRMNALVFDLYGLTQEERDLVTRHST